MHAWQKCFRDGFAPLLSTPELLALESALVADDVALLQGATTSPPPLVSCRDWPVEAACPVSYCGWRGQGLATVHDVEDYFCRLCFEADCLLGEEAGCRWFLNWWDSSPRADAVPALLALVRQVLAERTPNAA